MDVNAASATFVGRTTELAEISRLLANPACRLLTLVGPGGIGKTRLALEAVRRFPSAHFVALQSLASAEFIVSAIADAVGLQFYSGADPKQQLLDYLREKSWLLLLDNFEHLLDGATLLSEILVNAPALRLLVTSRERLNLVEEWVLEVGGLAYPSNENERDAQGYSAVELFVERARRVNVSFVLSEAQQPAVVRICRLVGGMPLGIELAASWTRALSCEAIAAEIERSLDILESPARNVEPRHRTMRAALDQSWQLLSEAERDVFMRLSVFRGGFTREAAEHGAGASLRILSALVDKSLVRVDANGRYDLHELLRQYATDKLDEAGATHAAKDSHLAYCLKLAEQAEAHIWGRGQIYWFDQLEIEFDNLRAAFAWALEDEASETSLRFATALGWFFSERMHEDEGLTWLERALALRPNAPVFLRAKALQNAGRLASGQAETRRYCEQAFALASASDDRWNAAWALSHQGMKEITDSPQDAAAKLDESLRLFRELEDRMGLCHTLVRRSWSDMRRGDSPSARVLLEEALVFALEADDILLMGWIRFVLAQIAEVQDHDLRQARSLYETGLSLFREARFSPGVVFVLNRLAPVEQTLGNQVRAQTLFRESLLLWGQLWPHDSANDQAFVGLANAARATGQFERAAYLLAAVNRDALIDYFIKFSELKDSFEADVISVRSQLGEAAFDEAWTAAKAMTREQAIAYALAQDMDTAVSQRDQPRTPVDLLTERELEILRLIADGLTNGEIADQLVLATSTIKWYVNQIFGKLEASSRTQAVARARTLRLLS